MSQRRTWIAGVAAVAIVAIAVGAFLLKRRSDRRAELVARARSYIQALADLEACLGDGKQRDFLTGVVFAGSNPSRQKQLDACAETFATRLETFGDTVSRLGIESARHAIPSPELHDLDEVIALQKLCTWLWGAHADMDALVHRIEQAPLASPACSVGDDRSPPMLASVGQYLTAFQVEPAEVVLRSETPARRENVTFFYRSGTPEKTESAVGYSPDGKDFTFVSLPTDVLLAAPAPKGFVALAAGRNTGVELRVHDGTSWLTAGRLPPLDVQQLHATAKLITIVGAQPARPTILEVRRSRDGGKTFGPPVQVLEHAPSDLVDVRVQPDSAVVAIAASASGLEIARLEADAAQAQPVAHLAFGASVAKPTLAVCRARDGYWALADAHHLVGSRDEGKTWRDVADLGDGAERFELYCTGDRVVATRPRGDDDGLDLVACTTDGCDRPLVIDRSGARLLFARVVDKDLELWIQDTSRPLVGDDSLVLVYRLANHALVPDRSYVLPLKEDDRHIRLANLDNTIAWLDPRSGLGDERWWNGPLH